MNKEFQCHLAVLRAAATGSEVHRSVLMQAGIGAGASNETSCGYDISWLGFAGFLMNPNKGQGYRRLTDAGRTLLILPEDEAFEVWREAMDQVDREHSNTGNGRRKAKQQDHLERIEEKLDRLLVHFNL